SSASLLTSTRNASTTSTRGRRRRRPTSAAMAEVHHHLVVHPASEFVGRHSATFDEGDRGGGAAIRRLESVRLSPADRPPVARGLPPVDVGRDAGERVVRSRR